MTENSKMIARKVKTNGKGAIAKRADPAGQAVAKPADLLAGDAAVKTPFLIQLERTLHLSKNPFKQRAQIEAAVRLYLGLNPADAVEAVLAAAMQSAAVDMLEGGAHGVGRDAQATSLRLAQCLAASFTSLLGELGRYRGKGQRVVVEHQHISIGPGAQAIVAGNLQHGGGGGNAQIEHQPQGAGAAAAECTPLLGHVQTVTAALPSADGAREIRVPNARRTRRGT